MKALSVLLCALNFLVMDQLLSQDPCPLDLIRQHSRLNIFQTACMP